MTKKLVQHGNSYALIIDKPILKMLGITPETALKMSTDGTTILITPEKELKKKSAAPKKVKKTKPKAETVAETAERIMKKYNDVFEKLAK